MAGARSKCSIVTSHDRIRHRGDRSCGRCQLDRACQDHFGARPSSASMILGSKHPRRFWKKAWLGHLVFLYQASKDALGVGSSLSLGLSSACATRQVSSKTKTPRHLPHGKSSKMVWATWLTRGRATALQRNVMITGEDRMKEATPAATRFRTFSP